MTRRTRVAIVAVDHVLALDVAGPAEVLAQANLLIAPRKTAYEPIYLSRRGGRVRTASGLVLDTRPIASVEPASIDTLLIAGGRRVVSALEDVRLVDWIARVSPKVRRVCSVCTGSFFLAAAGLLDGRRAVTHWDYAAEFRARFPKVRLDVDPIYVRDGRIWSSAGVTAGIDLALALVQNDLGRRIAIEVAKQLVVFVKRPGGQAQFSSPLVGQSAAATRSRDARLERIQAWMIDNLSEDLSVERMAERAGMPSRTFCRLFVQHMGTTPAKQVQALRLEAAQRQLEETRDPLKKLAADCGFGSEERMRRAFVRSLGVSPGDYRRRFAGAPSNRSQRS